MQTIIGKVISTKVANTVTVAVDYYRKHPKYKKVIKRATKLLAHNMIEGVQVGDMVRIVKSKPYSKRKHFVVTEKVQSKGS